MAIQKEKILKSGVSGNYWKITKESYDLKNLSANWEIELFLSKAASDDGKASLGLKKSFSAPMSKIELSGNRTAFGYDSIKAQALLVKPFGQMGDSDIADGIDV